MTGFHKRIWFHKEFCPAPEAHPSVQAFLLIAGTAHKKQAKDNKPYRGIFSN
jgi:hypothetical protein